MTKDLNEDKQMNNVDLNNQEVKISFSDLPDYCFVNPNDRPLGSLVTLPILVRKKYRGIKLGKATANAVYTNPTNLIRILTKKDIFATFLLGDGDNFVEIHKNVSGKLHFALWHKNQVHIGARTTANLLNIEARKSMITIGRDCMISEAWIQATDMHGVWSLETKQSLNKVGYSVIIEDGVWVGRRASIVRPAIIGRGAIIAFGAVVTKNVPPCSIVAGNPAQITRRNVTWTRNFNDRNELNERVSSMQLEAELIDLTPKSSRGSWLNQLSYLVQKLKNTLFKRAKHYG